ncbi:MAG: anthranilate synthase component I [Desulfobacteraceae bacterium]|nr:anthranilate synthase component I [Desulfobacteraceae bacterium]
MILNNFPSKDEFIDFSKKSNVIPVCAEVLADTETPVSILKKFYKKNKPLFLLESVEGQERWARYSFLGISANKEIKIFSNEVEIINKTTSKKILHHGDPLSVLKDFLNQYQPAEIPGLPRFWSGLTGYLSYEMISFFEEVPVSLPEDTPYAHFIIPEVMIIFDNMKHTMTCLNICYLDENCDCEKEYSKALINLTDIISFINKPLINQSTASKENFELKPEVSATQYINGVQKIKQHIVDGDVIQAVYSQPFTCKSPPDPVMIYRAQRYVNPSPYMFFMNFKDITIAGSSPETMVRLENNIATLRPIAGTRPRGKTEQQDRLLADELLNDEKERAEHVMLVDLGRNDLGRVAKPGTVQITDNMFIERYSHVMHLVSNITCDLKQNIDAFDLLKATFPAGTLSGAPKIRAMEIIADLEDSPRNIYGGAAGYISFSGNMDLAITIRTAVMEKDKLTIQAGAGIVSDSDPEKELEECINKAKSVEAALKLATNSLDNFASHGGDSC